MFKFYGMDMSPPCSAVLVALDLAGVDYNYQTVDLIKGDHMKNEFLAINPNHTVPTIVDGDLTLCESRAIIQYAFNKYAPKSNIYPADPAARAKIDSLLYYDQGSFYKTVSKYIYNSLGIRYGKRNDPEEKKAFWEQVDFIEAHLIKGKFLTGDNMTIADVSLAMSMSMPMVYLGSNCYAKHPKVKGERFDITDKEFIHCPNTSVIYVACVFHLKRRLILA